MIALMLRTVNIKSKPLSGFQTMTLQASDNQTINYYDVYLDDDAGYASKSGMGWFRNAKLSQATLKVARSSPRLRRSSSSSSNISS